MGMGRGLRGYPSRVTGVLGDFAKKSLPALPKPDADLRVADQRAINDNMTMGADDIPVVDQDGIDAQNLANMEGLWQKAVRKGMTQEDGSPFNFAQAYDTHRKILLPGFGTDQPFKSTIQKTNGVELLRGAYGDKMAENIAEAFVSRNRPGDFGLLNVDRRGAEHQLQMPAYILRGQARHPDAAGLFDPLQRYLYWQPFYDKSWVPTHEATHATLEGMGPRNDQLLEDFMPGPMETELYLHRNRAPGDSHSARLADALLRQDLTERYPLDRMEIQDGEEVLKPNGGAAEIIADLAEWSRDTGAVMGTTDRSKKFLDSILQKLLDQPMQYGPDPVIQIGPRAGQPAQGLMRKGRAIKGIYESSPEDAFKEMLREGLFKSGSVTKKPEVVHA